MSGRAKREDEIRAILEDLGNDELEVLALVAEGLAKGRPVYGELVLDTDGRDMEAEALEEVRDGLIYTGSALLRVRRGRPKQ